MSTEDELFQKVLSGESDGVEANDLLTAFQRGYPIEKVGELLDSPDQHALKMGVWITSELGSRSRPFLARMACFLTHATANEPDVIARVLLMTEDREFRVRRMATRFVILVPRDNLNAGLRWLRANAKPEWLEEVMATWYAVCEGDYACVSALIDNDHPVARRFGLALAVRIRDEFPQALQHATESHDAEVSRTAKEWKKLRWRL